MPARRHREPVQSTLPELSHPRSEGAGVFIHPLPVATLPLPVASPGRGVHSSALTSAHGQAELSKAGSCDQRKFSGQETLVAQGGGAGVHGNG